MYLGYFGLNEDPFRVTPDRRYYFAGASQRDVTDRLVDYFRRGSGLASLTGPAGSGKTLRIHAALKALHSNIPSALLWNANLGRDDFLASVCSQLGLYPRNHSEEHRLKALQAFAAESAHLGRRPVIVVDDADNLRDEVLQWLPGIYLNGKKSADHIAILLACEDSGYEALLQSIGAEFIRHEFRLKVLSESDVRAYVIHRLRQAGSVRDDLFSDQALDRIVSVSRGIPRLINAICGKALLLSYLGDQRQVDADLVDEAGQEIWVEGGKASAAPVAGFAQHLGGMAGIGVQQARTAQQGHVERREPVMRPEDRMAYIEPAAVRSKEPVVVLPEEPVVVLPGEIRVDDSEQDRYVPAGEKSRDVQRKRFLVGVRRVSLALVAIALLMIIGSNDVRRWLYYETGWPVFLALPEWVDGSRIKTLWKASSESAESKSAIIELQLDADGLRALTPQAAGDSGAASGTVSGVDPATQHPASPNGEVIASADELRTGSAGWIPASTFGLPRIATTTSKRIRIAELLQEAAAHIKARRFTVPKGRNAFESYRKILLLEPEHLQARLGVQEIRDRYYRWGRFAEAEGDLETATLYYRSGLKIAPEDEELEAALQRTEVQMSSALTSRVR